MSLVTALFRRVAPRPAFGNDGAGRGTSLRQR
jgi:hypothetical protein